MARTTITDTVVILDDESFNLVWMIEYIEKQKLKYILFNNVNEILNHLHEEIYRCLILDLNVPVLPPLNQEVERKGEVFRRFPGLYVATYARNAGYRGRQVLIYSVHRDEAVDLEARKLGCTYIRKGRPREMKAELSDVLSYDPTSDV